MKYGVDEINLLFLIIWLLSTYSQKRTVKKRYGKKEKNKFNKKLKNCCDGRRKREIYLDRVCKSRDEASPQLWPTRHIKDIDFVASWISFHFYKFIHALVCIVPALSPLPPTSCSRPMRPRFTIHPLQKG